MLKPNEEQIKAIEHHGGVLLEAGAGSGKTAVLVEHIAYLLEQYAHSGKNDFAHYLSRIVVMTFTRKAAGELRMRLRKRFILLQERLPELKASDLDSLFIGTIHGFCLRLIRMGVIAGPRTDVNIKDDLFIKAKIEKIYKRFCVKALVSDMIFFHEDRIIEGLTAIFLDPSLRLQWANIKEADLHANDIDGEKYFNELASVASFKQAWTLEKFNLEDFSCGEKIPAWYPFLKSYIELRKSLLITDWDSYQSYISFFAQYKRLPNRPKEDESLACREFYASVKDLKEFLLKYQEDFQAYFEHRNGLFRDWFLQFKRLFDDIEEHYLEEEGFSYADIEYYVLAGLSESDVSKRIASLYDYFIVDEFQDTSFVQYDILKKLTLSDHKRLFCVGDVKQAIYGFRGGELDVFLSCQKEMPLNLFLKNNYRSLPHVIEFNNRFFDFLFSKGPDFCGEREVPFTIQRQQSPDFRLEKKEETGQIVQIKVRPNADPEVSFSNSHVASFEASGICKFIESWLASHRDDQKTLAVLYKKLAPAMELVPMLLSSNMAFGAQIKIPQSEDPLLGMFKVLLEYYLMESHHDRRSQDYVFIMTSSYLEHLGIIFEQDTLLDVVNLFLADVSLFGPVHAFRKFLLKLGVALGMANPSLSFLDELALLCMDDCELLWKKIDEETSEKVSIEFQAGSGRKQIQIMTTHASKGLEFDCVILAGISTNGKNKPSTDYIKTWPGSFLWKDSSQNRKMWKSPNYILENMIEGEKEFAENKRLFYVACTRAKETLAWVEIENVKMSIPANSWINGLKNFFGETDLSELDVEEFIVDDTDLDRGERYSSRLPFYFQDHLGHCFSGHTTSSALISELSVTRLVSVAECPYKFYLKNCCRIESSDLEKITSVLGDEAPVFVNMEISSAEVAVSSSKERGIDIHWQIQRALEDNFKSMPESLEHPAYWVLEELKNRSSVNFLSERDLTFSFAGVMISGVADLIIQSGSGIEIWDFKTGAQNPLHEKSYWYQLYFYAYACWQLGLASPLQKNITLVLCYVDEHRKNAQALSRDHIQWELEQLWSTLDNVGRKQYEHCPECEYRVICQRP